jgi:hypothetical protein
MKKTPILLFIAKFPDGYIGKRYQKTFIVTWKTNETDNANSSLRNTPYSMLPQRIRE